jgi:hypothetical protein
VLQRLLICLAFSTCCFLNTWVELAEGDGVYFARYAPIYTVVVPVVCWEMVLTLGLFGAWEFCCRRPPKYPGLFHALFLVICLWPLGIASIAALRILPLNLIPVIRNPWFWPAALLAAVTPLGLAVLRPRTVSRFMRAVFLYSWLVLALVLFQGVRGTLLKYPPGAYADGPLAVSLRSPPSNIRVVWIIFDELSQTIAFGNRPVGLHLPNLDRLRRESFYTSSAIAPADSTEESIPALTIGEPVLEAIPDGPDDLRLRTPSRSTAFAWSSLANVFDSARGLGFNTAVVGWYHPYGRVLNRSLTRCYWSAGWLVSGIEERLQPQSLADAMWDRARLQLTVLPLVGHLPGVSGMYHRMEKGKQFPYLLARAGEIVADASIGLALIHIDIPHPPAIYSRSEGKITANGPIGYLDNVALVDRSLGELRQRIDSAGLGNCTALLVSADHGWRTYLWRGGADWTDTEEAASHNDTSGVPFLLKLPGQTSGVAYGKRFNTIITRQLITDILEKRLTDPSRISDAIDRYGKNLRY